MIQIDPNSSTSLQPSYVGPGTYLVALHDLEAIAIELCPTPDQRDTGRDNGTRSFERQVRTFYDRNSDARVTLGFALCRLIEILDTDYEHPADWPLWLSNAWWYVRTVLLDRTPRSRGFLRRQS
jgi:hypothetical protein